MWVIAVVVVVGYLWICVLIAERARRKGRSFTAWLIFSAFISPLWTAMIVSAMSANAQAEGLENTTTHMSCPRCAEPVRRAAVMCRFCGLELTGVERPPIHARLPAPRAELISGPLYQEPSEIESDIRATAVDGVPLEHVEAYWHARRDAGQIDDDQFAAAQRLIRELSTGHAGSDRSNEQS